MEKKILFDAFGHELCESSEAVKLDTNLLAKYIVELDPATGVTQPIISGYEDLTELINSYKASCGMEYVQRLLRTGQLNPADLADDGKHSGDGTLSTQINVAFQEAQTAKAKGTAIADSLGLGDVSKMSTEELNAIISQKVAEMFAKQTSPAASGGEVKKESNQ